MFLNQIKCNVYIGKRQPVQAKKIGPPSLDCKVSPILCIVLTLLLTLVFNDQQRPYRVHLQWLCRFYKPMLHYQRYHH